MIRPELHLLESKHTGVSISKLNPEHQAMVKDFTEFDDGSDNSDSNCLTG
jgi:hypothetical protein